MIDIRVSAREFQTQRSAFQSAQEEEEEEEDEEEDERRDKRKEAHLAEPIDGVGQQVRQVLVVSGSRVLHILRRSEA